MNSVTIHYTAGPATQTWAQVAAYQVGPSAQEQFPAIAYHLGVDWEGEVAYLQDLDRRVWHSAAPGANNTSVGIVYTGNVRPNDRQIAGLKAAIAFCEQQLGRSLTIYGHKDSYPTQCPGALWPGWKDELE